MRTFVREKWLRKYTYTWYTAQDQATTFKLKIEKCMSVSVTVKQLDIHIYAIQGWVKQYEECLDSILTGRKKAADVFWVRNTKWRLPILLMLISLLLLSKQLGISEESSRILNFPAKPFINLWEMNVICYWKSKDPVCWKKQPSKDPGTIWLGSRIETSRYKSLDKLRIFQQVCVSYLCTTHKSLVQERFSRCCHCIKHKSNNHINAKCYLCLRVNQS